MRILYTSVLMIIDSYWAITKFYILSLYKSGLPYVEVLCKNRYVGRTFIQPNTRLRQLGVAKKFGALTDNFAGKRVVLIDDSIVRGNTISPIIKLLKEAGATEVKCFWISFLFSFFFFTDTSLLRHLTGPHSRCITSNPVPVLHGHQYSYQRGANC